jgi:hypothetical protein
MGFLKCDHQTVKIDLLLKLRQNRNSCSQFMCVRCVLFYVCEKEIQGRKKEVVRDLCSRLHVFICVFDHIVTLFQLFRLRNALYMP